jgi:hypothetical protein
MRMSGSIIVLPATTRGGLLFGLLTPQLKGRVGVRANKSVLRTGNIGTAVCGSASLIFNNYDLSHSEQFDTDLFSVLVSTSVTATVEGKMPEKKAQS